MQTLADDVTFNTSDQKYSQIRTRMRPECNEFHADGFVGAVGYQLVKVVEFGGLRRPLQEAGYRSCLMASATFVSRLGASATNWN